MKRFIFYIILILGVAGLFLGRGRDVPAAVIPETQEQLQLSFAPLVKQAAPAVVNIYTKRVVRQRVISPFFNDPFFQRFFGGRGLGGGPVRERLENSLGSGVIVQSDGMIVSNAHVIKDAQEVTVVLHDGREFDAEIKLLDERTDLAVLQIDPEGEVLPRLALGDSDALEVGDLVLAIGNPFGVGQTVTSGIVSGVARTNVGISDYSFFIQTDAAINPGNSGGALVDMKGRLVGVNTAIFSKSGGSLGINFAVPANMVEAVLLAAMTGDKVKRPWFGASIQTVTSDLAENLGLTRPRGAMVTDLYPRGPADKSGLLVGDVIVSINGKEVQDPHALKFRFATVPLGQTAELDVFRAGTLRKIEVKAEGPPEEPPRNETALTGHSPFSGATVANVNPALMEELGLRGFDTGVILTSVNRPSRAASFGLRTGDRILNVNDADIEEVSDLREASEEKARSWRIVVQRGRQILTMVFSG